jgi:hypothetical protein
VIGGIASASSLTTSFCVVAALVGVIALAAGVLRPKRQAVETSSTTAGSAPAEI